MKIATLFSLFSAVALAGALVASAEEFGKATFVLSAGIGLPSGPKVFSDYWKTGFGGSGGVEMNAGSVGDYTLDG